MGWTHCYNAQIWPVIARGSHSFTCHPLTNHTCLYSPARGHHFGWYSLRLPTEGWPGWVDPGDWLYTDWDRFFHTGSWTTDTVTHPSTNRAQRRLTSLIETNALTTTPDRHKLIKIINCWSFSIQKHVPMRQSENETWWYSDWATVTLPCWRNTSAMWK